MFSAKLLLGYESLVSIARMHRRTGPIPLTHFYGRSAFSKKAKALAIT